MMDELTPLLVVVMSVITIMAQMYRESRKRRWDEEDRQRLATEVASALKVEAAELAEALQRETNAARKAVSDNTEAIKGVREAADAAYKEANHVNLKISDLNERLIRQQNTESNGPIKEIQNTTRETKAIVKSIDDRV